MKLRAAMIMRALGKREAEKVRRFAAESERLFGPGCRLTIRPKTEFPHARKNPQPGRTIAAAQRNGAMS